MCIYIYTPLYIYIYIYIYILQDTKGGNEYVGSCKSLKFAHHKILLASLRYHAIRIIKFHTFLYQFILLYHNLSTPFVTPL